ncbi:MAG TPA: amidase family protein [Pyrinomonadaceae bacterium]|nr:amidase family protein [Pyrinomonadaceae bacterium]
MIASLSLIALMIPVFAWQNPSQSRKKFEPTETTIAEIHQAIRSGRITCRQLVEAYLKRIDAYDQPTKLNSIVIVNPQALAEADRLDEEFKRTRKLRPLHGIPVIVKDNFDTKDLQTTGGSLALKGSVPPDDAFQVRKIREAGAIVLAKSNMAEWAFSPMLTESSIAGVTRNPYDLERVPAGSSGGTAAAVAANFGAVGLGTDTGNSIRGPSSHNALVGIRSTMGLTSRDGIIPLYLRNDIGGPIARTVEDAVRVLEVIAGYDQADPITKFSEGKIPKNYTQFLKKTGLKGARLGVFRRYVDAPTTDPQIKALVAKAVEDLKAQGAIIVDPFDVPNYDELTKDIWCNSFHYDVNKYLASLGEKGKYKNLTAIVESGLYSPYIERRLKDAIRTTPTSPPCKDLYRDPRSVTFRASLLKAMMQNNLDAIIYPTWSNPPRKIGDLQSPAGDNSQILSPQTGFPAITVPMGYTNGSLPAGLTFLGKLFSEPDLIKFVYAYEHATKHRRPPERFPSLEDR